MSCASIKPRAISAWVSHSTIMEKLWLNGSEGACLDGNVTLVAKRKGRHFDAAGRSAGGVGGDGRSPADRRTRDQGRVEAYRGFHVFLEPKVLCDLHRVISSLVIRAAARRLASAPPAPSRRLKDERRSSVPTRRANFSMRRLWVISGNSTRSLGMSAVGR